MWVTNASLACRFGGSVVALAGLVALLAFAAPPAGAELRQLEVVGAVPLDEESRKRGIPKDRAIEAALWEGVSRVAAELLVDSDAIASEGSAKSIEKALGRDVVSYTKSFRIVEDQGERPALFTEHPDAATEYVVVVELEVDTDRVREALVAAGLLAEAGAAALKGIELDVRGLTDYAGYLALVALVQSDRVGAAAVDPREYERGRALLRVEAEWGASELLERLLAAAPPQLRITPVEVDEDRGTDDVWAQAPGRSTLVVEVEWTPPPDPDADGMARN
jgi:hypothetical protein